MPNLEILKSPECAAQSGDFGSTLNFRGGGGTYYDHCLLASRSHGSRSSMVYGGGGAAPMVTIPLSE